MNIVGRYINELQESCLFGKRINFRYYFNRSARSWLGHRPCLTGPVVLAIGPLAWSTCQMPALGMQVRLGMRAIGPRPDNQSFRVIFIGITLSEHKEA